MKLLRRVAKRTFLFFIHLVFQTRLIEKEIKKFAKNIHHKKILEIGSGKNSAKKYFDKDNDFIESDIKPVNKNIRKIDVSKMNFKSVYDIIMAISVFDDVFNYQKAINNIYRALCLKGKIFLIIPMFYPIHDIPHDYFRFTEFALRKIFCMFKNLKIKSIGLRNFPSFYIIIGGK